MIRAMHLIPLEQTTAPSWKQRPVFSLSPRNLPAQRQAGERVGRELERGAFEQKATPLPSPLLPRGRRGRSPRVPDLEGESRTQP